MVVLAAAVCSKAGKAIFSRQFVAMPRVRVEGLVAAFPKLIGADTQHTFVETEAVRYVYQPVEQLYMILVTTKGSNIIEDLETLRLFVKLIPEYCQGHTEDHVKRHAFDLVMAMDEVVNLGYKEQVTVPQIKTFTDMDSHEEKLQKIIYESKISEARAAAQKKAESIDKQKAEMRKAQMESRGGGGGRYGSSGIGSDYSPMAPAASSPAMSREQQEDELSLGPSKIKAGGFGSFATEKKETKPSGKPARGMQLGKAKPQDDFVASIVKEEKLVTPVGGPVSMGGMAAAPVAEAPKDKVFVKIEEKVVIHLERDGAIKKFEIKGEIKVVVQDPDQSRIFLRMNQTFRKEDGFVARLHPKIDKTAWEKNGVLALKDQGPNSRFPVGVDNAAVILKWRKVTSDDSELPFSVNFWPNDEDGKTVVNAEISHVKGGLAFQHVYLTVPFKQAQPQINSADGDVKFTRQDGLMWRIDEISENNPSATLEFAIPEVPADSLFPLHLNFYATSTYANLAVEEILLVDGQAPVEFNQDVSLSSEEFLVE